MNYALCRDVCKNQTIQRKQFHDRQLFSRDAGRGYTIMRHQWRHHIHILECLCNFAFTEERVTAYNYHNELIVLVFQYRYLFTPINHDP